jgi:two-component system, cell cycle sensor histidine kinase and response regulator CckA
VMPEMNGAQLARCLRGRCPSLRTLFISGYTAEVVLRQGVQDQERNFLAKPFTLKDLAARVREVLDAASEPV